MLKNVAILVSPKTLHCFQMAMHVRAIALSDCLIDLLHKILCSAHENGNNFMSILCRH